MPPRKPKDGRPDLPEVRYAPLGHFKIYEIDEAELNQFESGPPGQFFLSVALAMLPAALTVLITLQTVEIKNIFTFCFYWIAFFGLAVPAAFHSHGGGGHSARSSRSRTAFARGCRKGTAFP